MTDSFILSNVTNPRETATDHLDAVRVFHQHLREERLKPRRDHEALTRIGQDLGRGLKLAEVNALLHIGDQLEQLVASLTRDDVLDVPTPSGKAPAEFTQPRQPAPGTCIVITEENVRRNPASAFAVELERRRMGGRA